MNLVAFKWDQDADGIVTLSWDDPARTMNVLSNIAMKDLAAAAEKVASDASIKGLIITSGKTNGFCAGAALDEMESSASGAGAPKSEQERVAERFKGVMQFHHLLRRLETCGKPVVAAINGLALGGGLEVTLACHYRIVADNPKIQLGLPESKVGLLPGGGGTQRLPRLIGAGAALPLIMQGTSLDPASALKQGVVHKVVPAAALIGEAKKWIKETPNAKQPWDDEKFKVPGGGPHSPGGSQTFTMGNALFRKTAYNNYPAQRYILSCVYEGIQVPIEAGLRIEARYFTKLLMDPASRNMIRSLFLSMQELGKGARRPEGEPETKVKKLGILGAGMMGAGIAYVSAQAGIEVVLLDTAQEAAEKGKAYSEKLLDKALERGKTTPEKKAELLARIKPTTNYADLAGVDLIVEAVFETREIKADVTKKAEAVIPAGAIFGSNTSTLPITGLAEASVRPDQFIGIHFFSPVDKMGLVEIIMGKKTGSRALAVAIDYVKQIKKTPIVVNDSRGFYTSRCFGTYVAEGQEMLAEGIAPAIIDNVGRATGMPRGPLELADDVALDLAYKVRAQTKKDLGDKYVEGPSDALIEAMVVKNNRLGRKNGKGFYDYPANGPKRLWHGLADLVKVKVTSAEPDDVDELKKRFLYRQAVEAARCFEENVVTDPRDGDVGAILGWGFAPYTGGPLSLIDSVGLKKFVEECDRMAQKYGPRFAPGKLLRDMAAKGDTFYGRFNPAKKAA
ncbi:MAG TPA: 3-hydroxyacyl-CoA dehydrogenase NAD-binding domain-containing protein [Micropepsaceae bacterium]|nr:3-hydroxyacyl-CoA dehydrogenase NAD-binding domain-containing protein [Micropepsaceae bacterium]